MRRLAIATALLACAVSSPAEASTLTNSGGRLTFTATGAARLSVSFQYGRTGYVAVIPQPDSADPVTMVAACATVTASFVYYTCDGVTAVTFTGGNGNDSVNAFDLDEPLTADGGGGDDYLRGGNVADSLSGGPGDDYIEAATGDTVSGGPGVDSANYMPPGMRLGPVNITLDGVADDGVAGDGVNLLGDVEDVDADFRYEYFDEPLPTYGPVTMVGTDSGNRLTGSSGADTITGGGGIDVLEGMAGDDTLLARDGLADRVRCGPGVDRALVDPFDQISDTCEFVEVEGASPEDAPPRIGWRPGSALGIAADDDHGIASVQWLDDDRVICTDTTPPFDCDYRPRVEDVGRNTFTAIATDTVGQTASVTLTRTVARFKPLAVSLRVKRSGHRYIASGTVKLPAGIPCSGTVAVGTRKGRLGRTCAFRVFVPRAATYVAKYVGTDAIAPLRSKAVRRPT
jgi:Ca2+-binding RTX toxin-like protein